MADGKITFSTELDNKELEKGLSKLNKNIESSEKKLSALTEKRKSIGDNLFDQKGKQSGIKAELEAAKDEAMQTESVISDLKAQISEMEAIRSNGGSENPAEWVAAETSLKEAKASLKEQEAILARQNKEAEKLDGQYTKITDQVNKTTESLMAVKAQWESTSQEVSDMKAQAVEMTEQIEASAKNQSIFGDAVNATGKGFDALLSRASKLVSRVFVFSMITTGLRAVRDWMGQVIENNDEASAAVARLKGAFLTMMQPLMSVVIPIFTTLVNLLTAIIGKIAALFSMLGGKTVKQSADAAKALNNQGKAYKNVGKQVQKATKQLMGFDEINKLESPDTSTAGSGGGSSDSGIQPDFEWADGISETLDRIANYVFLIGAGFALWKIGSMLPGQLGDILSKLGLIMIAIGGLLIAWDGVKDAWENGVDWGNMAEMILGVAIAAGALYMAFGSIAAGITLIVGGAVLLVTAFHDMMKNGANLKNTLLAIAGIMMAGLGISLLVGSFIPLLIAGIASLLLALTVATGHGGELIDGLKQVCSGFLDFITGVFSGDWDKAWQGIVSVGKGAVNILISIINSMIDLVVRGLNMLSFDIPDWVPFIGGGHFGFNIQKAPQIPYLAQGAVIPPNREFLAVLGDQSSGNNIEAPESLIRKIVREETRGMSSRRVEELLETLISVVNGIEVGDETIGRAAARYNRVAERARGY